MGVRLVLEHGLVLRWAAPALVLVAALAVQSSGLLTGTAAYVKWIDTIQRADVAVRNKANATGRLTVLPTQLGLDDSLLDSYGPRHLRGGALVQLLTAALPLAWFFWVLAARDLRNWSRTLLAASLCAVLKGLVAGSTMLPDAGGWAACYGRLGPGGAAYYLELEAFGGIPATAIQAAFGELRSLWQNQRRYYCADAMFSTTVCYGALASLALVQRLRSSGGKPAHSALLGLALGLLVCANILLAIVSKSHYTADIAVACILAPLLYGNPAVVLAAEQWSTTNAQVAEALEFEASEDGPALEVFASPLCIPGRFRLRSRPEGRRRDDDMQAKGAQRRRLAELRGYNKQAALRQKQLEAELADVIAAGARKEQESAASGRRALEERLLAERLRLETAGAKLLAEARREAS